MSAPLPLAAFPIGAASKNAGFVLAVLVGLAFYLAARDKANQPRQSPQSRPY